MKIAHLNTYDNGGAGKAALRLNRALNLIGEESKLFVKYKSIQDESTIQIVSKEISSYLFDSVITKFQKYLKEENTMSSLMYPSVGFEFLNCLKSYDIINLHWLSYFISVEAIMKIDSMLKPIIWTLHDQNPLVATCHYTHGCEKYMDFCCDCPQLINNQYNWVKSAMDIKMNHLPKNIVLVSPSQWLAECAKNSTLFKNNRIEVIQNSIETDIYEKINKKSAKVKIGFNENTKIIVFGAWDLREKRKGTKYLIEASKYLSQKTIIQKLIKSNQLMVLSFGEGSATLDALELPHKSLGCIQNDEELAIVYSAADVTVLPSLEDNLPNNMLESLSCGTPVVAFSVGGIKETIIDGYNGYLCEVGDSVTMADNITKAIVDEDISANCRKYAINHFRGEIQAKRYLDLYTDVLSNYINSANIQIQIPRVMPEIANQLIELMIDASFDVHDQIDELKYKLYLEECSKTELLDQKNSLEYQFCHLTKEKENIEKLNEQLRNTQILLEKNISILNAEVESLSLTLNQKEHLILIKENEIEHEHQDSYRLREKLENSEDELEQYKKSNTMMTEELKNLNYELWRLKTENEDIQLRYEQILHSTIWSISKPIRFILRKFKRLIKFCLPYALVQYYQKRHCE